MYIVPLLIKLICRVHQVKAGIKIARRNTNNLRYADGTTLMAEKLESRLPEEIPITSDTQMVPPLWQKAKRN